MSTGNPTGGESFSPPRIVEAFGFLVTQEQSATIQNALTRSQGVVDLMKSNIQSGTIGQLAEAAATTAVLQNKIADTIQTTLGNAAQAAVSLQQPIEQHIATQLAQSGGNVVGLGVNLPNLNCPADMPTCVLIKQEAQAGRIDTALCYYRNTIVPLSDPKQPQYFAARNWLEQCMSGFDSLLNQVESAGAQMESQHAIGQNVIPPPQIIPASLESGSVTQSQAGQTGSGTVGKTSLINPAIPQALAPFLPGVGSGVPSTSGGATKPVTPQGPSQTFPGCAVLAQMGYDQAIQNYPAGHYTIAGGWTVSLAYGTDPATGDNFATVQCINCPPGIGPPPGVCNFTTNVAPQIPTPTPPVSVPPATPQTPTTPTPPPQCPSPPTCQPVQVNVTCEKPTPQDQTQPRTYCVWKNPESGVCQVGTQDQGPPSPNWQQLFCGKIDAAFVQNAIQQCCQQQQQSSSTPSIYVPATPPGAADIGCNGLYRFQSLTQGIPPTFFSQLFSAFIEQDIANSPPGPSALTDGIAKAVLRAGGKLGGDLIDGLMSFSASLPILNCSGTQGEGALLLTQIILGFIEKYISAIPPQTTVSLQYARNTLCPYKIPSAQEAATAYLQDTIDADRLRCIVEANGNRYDSFWPVVYGSRAKLNLQQYGALYMREKISSTQLQQYSRALGYLEPGDIQNQLDLLKVIPPPGDIVAMMTKDAADTTNIDWSKEDALFPQKYTDQLKQWGHWQGIDDEYMKLLWRAHFGIPSPGQLFEMRHRLSRLDPSDPRYVSQKDVENALVQQDISPKWIQQYLAISDNPLTRIDARRAFEIGALDQDGLKNSYLDLGYSDQAASTLVDFNIKNRTRTILRRPEIKQYADGEITQGEYTQTLKIFGAGDDDIQAGLDYAILIGTRERRKKCIRGIRQQYFIAELDFAGVVSALQDQGLGGDQATELANGMVCERQARGKTLTGENILDLYRNGVISEGDAFNRLMTVGFTEDAAVLRIRRVAQQIQAKINADQLKALKQEQAAAARIARQLKAAAKEAQAAAAKAQSAALRSQHLREQREKRLLEAGKLVSEHTGIEYGDAVFFVKTLHQSILANNAVTIDESVQAIGVAASDKNLTTTDQIATEVARSIAALAGATVTDGTSGVGTQSTIIVGR